MKTNIIQSWEALTHLLFPDLCACCHEEPPMRDRYFCLSCHMDIPYTDHFQQIDNHFEKKFWGRIDVERAFALMYYDKGGLVREMIHNLKYHGYKTSGTALGTLGANAIIKQNLSLPLDVIIPVPIHFKKRSRRGYNQAELIANALGEGLHVPVISNLLTKEAHTTTQTDKGREERFHNVLHSFRCSTDITKYKHILIVDDVVTTGATLEACLQKIQEVHASAKFYVYCGAMSRMA